MHFGENPEEVLVEWELGFVCFVLFLFQSSSIVWFGEVSTVFWDLHSLFSFWPFYALSLSTGFLERECVSRLCGKYRLYSRLNKGKMPKQKEERNPSCAQRVSEKWCDLVDSSSSQQPFFFCLFFQFFSFSSFCFVSFYWLYIYSFYLNLK